MPPVVDIPRETATTNYSPVLETHHDRLGGKVLTNVFCLFSLMSLISLKNFSLSCCQYICHMELQTAILGNLMNGLPQ